MKNIRPQVRRALSSLCHVNRTALYGHLVIVKRCKAEQYILHNLSCEYEISQHKTINRYARSVSITLRIGRVEILYPS